MAKKRTLSVSSQNSTSINKLKSSNLKSKSNNKLLIQTDLKIVNIISNKDITRSKTANLNNIRSTQKNYASK